MDKAQEPRPSVEGIAPTTAVIPPTPTTLEHDEPFVRERAEPLIQGSPFDPPSPAKTEDAMVDNEERPPKRSGTGKSKAVTLDSDDSDDSGVETDSGKAYLSVYKEDTNMKQEQVIRRAVASVRYAVKLENRVTALEKELRNLRGEDKAVSKRAKSFQPPTHEVAVRYLRWDDFKPKPAPVLPNETGLHNFRPDPTAGSVLEILIEEPSKVRTQANKQPQNEQRVHMSEVPDGAEEIDFHTPPPDWLESGRPPCRLRIRSRPLLTVLKSVTNSNWALKHGKHVFLRPFKTFVSNEDKIREAFRKLEAKYERPKTPIDKSDLHEMGIQGSPMAKRPSPERGQDTLSGDESDDEIMDSPTAYEHMKLFMQFMDRDLKCTLELRRKIQAGTLETIAFDDLWHLFQIGQEVVAAGQEPGSLAIYRILTYTGGRELTYSVVDPPKNPASNSLGAGNWYGAFAVQTYQLAYDGEVYIPQGKTFGIQRYEGERKISDLAVYPLRFDPKRSELRDKLKARGRIFMDIASKKTTHRRYVGPNLDEDARGEQINSEVIIDFKEAFEQKEDWEPVKLNPDLDLVDHDMREWAEMYSDNRFCRFANCCTGDPVENDFSVDLTNERNFLRPNKHLFEPRKEIDDEDAILLPDRVYAYLLVTRKWAIISTSEKNLQSPTAYNPWDDLVIPADHKETVEALVRQHLARESTTNGGLGTNSSFGDLISSKGRGLVFLLHGPPGIGKTSTVECISAKVGKPLYSLTSGNLGTEPEKVEENLRWHFSLADKWGCILLLDEADVFLQVRVANQININAIVSVFLRQLEYYNGILFLTTNRVGSVDVAFKSRIHVTLEYKPLDLDATMQIYQNRLDRVVKVFEGRKTSSGSKPKVKTNEILDWAEQHYLASAEKRRQWNGRQIQNAFETALALAEWDSRPDASGNASKSNNGERKEKRLILRKKHFEKVAKVAEGFDQYMVDLFGGKDESTRARINQLRMDYREQRAGATIAGASQGSRGGYGRRGRFDDGRDEEDEEPAAFSGGSTTRREPPRAARGKPAPSWRDNRAQEEDSDTTSEDDD